MNLLRIMTSGPVRAIAKAAVTTRTGRNVTRKLVASRAGRDIAKLVIKKAFNR